MIYSQDEIIAYLRNHNLKAVAREIGMNHEQVYRFFNERPDSRLSTVKKLSNYIKKMKGEPLDD